MEKKSEHRRVKVIDVRDGLAKHLVVLWQLTLKMPESLEDRTKILRNCQITVMKTHSIQSWRVLTTSWKYGLRNSLYCKFPTSIDTTIEAATVEQIAYLPVTTLRRKQKSTDTLV